MILIDKNDEVVKVAISVKDMGDQPDEMTITNRQSKETFDIYLYDISTDERCGVYQIYNIRESQPIQEDDITYISLPDGSYDYKFGSEIGLLQIGIPTLEKTEYQSNKQNIVYYGNE